MSKRSFVIADIHGCNKTFTRLLATLAIERTDIVYLLGDMIDRGPDSKVVIDTVIGLLADGFDIRCCLGNHEDMMLLAVHKGIFEDLLEWLENGGDATLESYGVEHPQNIPEEHLQFLESLPLYHLRDGFVMVHAGADCTLADPFSPEGRNYMLWDRTGVMDIGKLGGRKLVSGHCTRKLKDIRKAVKKNHLRIDNGCVYKGFADKGNLVALDLDSGELFVQENIDEEPVEEASTS